MTIVDSEYTTDQLKEIAKSLSNLGYPVIYLGGSKLKPLHTWTTIRDKSRTESEINQYFDDPNTTKPTALGIVLRAEGHRNLAIDIDGKDAQDVFWYEFVSLLPKDIQDDLKKSPRTYTKSDGIHIILRIEDSFTGILKQDIKWSDITIVGRNGDTKHSQINVLGTEHYSREFGAGYSRIIGFNTSKVRFTTESIRIILNELDKFKQATNVIRTAADILLQFWKSPDRDNVVFATSGFLGKNGVPENLTIRLFNHIMRVADLSDDNKEHTLEVIHTTYEKLGRRETVSGYERFKAIVKSDAIIDEIQSCFKQLGYFPDYFNGSTSTVNDNGYNENKKAILSRITDGTVRDMLISDIWTMVSENPLKFIVARRKACNICRASITYSDSKNGLVKVYLNYGSILIRLFPKQITLHESPLKFLEMSERYTIVFENQDRHEVVISGTIDGIISRLKEMPGYVISSYGIAEALTAIIGAFKDDGRLQIDKTVEFEGYYLSNNDVQISGIDLDVKHPRRTKQEVIDCIGYLDKRSQFQIWQDKQGNEIDRRDLLASLTQWVIPGPFNFVFKQQNCRPYLKGFAMTGERDGAKSSLSEEMLNVHGNPTNEHDADSKYSVSAGSVNTEAKFGKAVSRTTYPVEFSEFGRVETYGRHEDLVECFKTSVDALIVRRGKKDNRTDAPFPSLSTMIINGNPPFTFKGELLKRYDVAKFSEEDRHDRSPNSSFNTFQRANKHHWKTLGDWTIRYILDNKQELLLSKKYAPLEVGKKALEAFYKYGDSEVPEWLTRRMTDMSLEELDQDVEGIIRSILYNHLHKSLRDNQYLIDKEGMGALTIEQRIQVCLDAKVWPWIRKVERTGEELKYYINGSIMEIFSQRLPDLTLKKLSEKTGFEYVSRQGKKRIVCSKMQLDNFLTGEEV